MTRRRQNSKKLPSDDEGVCAHSLRPSVRRRYALSMKNVFLALLFVLVAVARRIGSIRSSRLGHTVRDGTYQTLFRLGR